MFPLFHILNKCIFHGILCGNVCVQEGDLHKRKFFDSTNLAQFQKFWSQHIATEGHHFLRNSNGGARQRGQKNIELFPKLESCLIWQDDTDISTENI